MMHDIIIIFLYAYLAWVLIVFSQISDLLKAPCTTIQCHRIEYTIAIATTNKMFRPAQMHGPFSHSCSHSNNNIIAAYLDH